ncbi:putative mitochondrial hypothetical protein [Leptomonas pyrrhocoris]|uniref:Uncharacterized protein n=1 Tax=Leptomonas pyrrhocoris TaxID=157538 RepID=A0A0M9G8T6_LEPPY|nr:putative mitochondrial hypothetical protein [Leptomonas pyrrhocoris]XP_015663618.1 putative mitochondrial hypothetical protein [Leptomonas pyrrhocoris]XP_015663619.1 putative mitochondrial hypothetical protein [Leptomonas pyrrhocoris]XP_015663620.1 putative mitochondrial hypothetical protein [Leptomonas pyrrhocoris]KPA85178.1 putative mitochondrial hypothetical protein [Leptomonas pyrrhocoris]KPA85179.1 putative mitochondrial hypothetical protein [Leptomonas pyrrhocoris]KPA85180.1 putative|eukprot:XP_015663617.1 putative mitochondrial hypothetical protein [Leptomonas pyrrhocoris]
MLRLTAPSFIVLQNPTLPRVLKQFTPDRMELMLISIKERKKRARYLGSSFQHYNDRWTMFGAQGTVRRGTRFLLERHHTRAQFVHPEVHRNNVDIRTVKMAGAQFDQLGNYTRTTWDHEIASTNMLNDPTFKQLFRDMPKDQALSMMEAWGVRYIVLDEIRKPSLMDCKYHKHSIYPDKFSWAPDPETNYFRGDAEQKWKGDELIAYADYNAHVQHPANFDDGVPTAKKAAAKPNPWFKATIRKHPASSAEPTATKNASATAAK